VSGSVQGESLAELKRAGDQLIAGLREPDRAALLTFADTLRLPVSLGSDRDLIHRRLEALEAVGGTSLRDGAFTAMTLGEAAGRRALAILFTDGEESVSWLGESDVLEAARRTPVVVYGVRIGEKAAPFLGQVVKATGGRTLHLRWARELSEAFAEILQEFRTRYVVSYTPRGVVRSGWHRTSVRVKGRSARVLVRDGYSVP
jgi:Mg-chelatase subunit ChlD